MNSAPEFIPVSLTLQEKYQHHFRQCPQKASDYSFINLWGWAEHYGLEWFFGPTHVWLRQTKPEIIYWAPIGPWHELDWTQCKVLPWCKESFIRVPEQLAEIWQKSLKERITLEEAPEHWDYIYSVPELAALSGNRFHKKKNLVNQFKKHHDFLFHSMTRDCVEDVLQMQFDWFNWRDAESQEVLAAENRAIEKVLTHWDCFNNLFGGVISVAEKKVAYTIGEDLGNGTLLIHFEKGHATYKGIYQAINQLFLQNEAQNFSLVNREQDLGDPGLRKAKQSYHPVQYLKKFRITIRMK